MAKRIKGVVKHFDLEGGFWGIVAEDDYLPLNMPEQLKTHNSKIECTIVIDDDVFTSFSWGTPCRVISFTTLNPF